MRKFDAATHTIVLFARTEQIGIAQYKAYTLSAFRRCLRCLSDEAYTAGSTALIQHVSCQLASCARAGMVAFEVNFYKLCYATSRLLKSSNVMLTDQVL